MPHIHLTILISARWSATSFSFLTSQVSLPCNILLRTQLLYNLPITINDMSLLVSNGTNCLNLFHPVHILASAAASALPFILKMSPETYPLTPNVHWHQYLHLCILWWLLDSCNLYKQNVFITLYMPPFIPLHVLCTHFWQLVHQHLYHRHHMVTLVTLCNTFFVIKNRNSLHFVSVNVNQYECKYDSSVNSQTNQN